MPFDFTGTWTNQLGSTLELEVVDGVVSGRFESGVGDDGEIIWVEIGGRVLYDLITFNALYPRFRTIISWVGQHTDENGRDEIRTHWIHTTDVSNEEERDWMWYSNRLGSDVFIRSQE